MPAPPQQRHSSEELYEEKFRESSLALAELNDDAKLTIRTMYRNYLGCRKSEPYQNLFQKTRKYKCKKEYGTTKSLRKWRCWVVQGTMNEVVGGTFMHEVEMQQTEIE
tara:strand:+ start:2090 stop:2413 length:324 start_codon:yes stop_codon:yes gene_type:complete